jgi:hypothetical protein
MMSKVHLCGWDSETGVLTTHWEAREKDAMVDLENATWFKDTFKDLDLDMSGAPNALSLPLKRYSTWMRTL